MQHIPMIESVRHAFRSTFCTICQLRPAHSEALGPMVARTCESTCSLFLHINKLNEIAEAGPGTHPGDYQLAIKNMICNGCCLKPTAGDYCVERLSCTCPLICFSAQAVTIIEGLLYAAGIAQERDAHSGRQLSTTTIKA
jgi:hypothetical protein